MQEPQNARRFVDILASCLENTQVASEQARAFVTNSVEAMRESTLERNSKPAASMLRYDGWESLLALAEGQRKDDLVAAIATLERENIPWIEGSHFWPDQKYQYFAQRMCGALLMGESGAAFYNQERFILLLHVMAPHTTYPLHEHRIPEGYYIVGGHPEFTGDGNHWIAQPPGSLYYNKSWAPHAIRTKAQPMLSINIYLPPFGWDGGLVPCEPKTLGG